jgi:uncharacterized metal-binding protein
MASGAVHSTVSIILAGLALAVTPVAGPGAVAVAAGAFTGVFVQPDLDHNGRMNAHSQVRRFGGVAGALLSFMWYVAWLPYASAVKHRSKLSHLPLLGTGIRVAYLMLVTLGGLGAVPGIAVYAWQNGLWSWYGYAGLWLVGLCLSDYFHFLFDVLKIKRGRLQIARLGG